MSLGSIVSMFFSTDIIATYKSWSEGSGTHALDITLGVLLFAACTVLLTFS